MLRPSILISNIAVLALAASTAAAAPRKPSLRTLPRTKAAAVPKRDPVDVLATQLTVNSIAVGETNIGQACSTSNFKGLAYALNDVVSDWNYDKGEFETSADYGARMARYEATINGDRRIIVCVPLAGESSGIRYNADTQQFSVNGYSLEHIDSFSKDTGSYSSSTRMGVKVRVYAGVRIDYELDFGSVSRYKVPETVGCKASSSLSELSFSVPAAVAPAIRSTGYVALIGHLRQPFVVKRTAGGSPTLDSPFDTSVMTLKVQFVPEEAALVAPTGERFSCDGQQKDADKLK